MTRGLVEQYEADAARKTREKTKRDSTEVRMWESAIPGVAELLVVGPKEDLEGMFSALDALAKSRQAAGDHVDTGALTFDPNAFDDRQKLTLGQQRVRALRDLIAANSTVSYELVLQLPVVRNRRATPGGSVAPVAGCRPTGEAGWPPSTAGSVGPAGIPGAARAPSGQAARASNGEAIRARGDQPPVQGTLTRCEVTGEHGEADSDAPYYRLGWGRLPGVGLIDPEVTRALIRGVGWKLTRALIDADSGVTVETAQAGYVPSAALRKFVQLRDGSCRGVGCNRPAGHCDLDHVIAWPQGATEAGNLADDCRRHHRNKTEGRWGYTIDGDGVCVWTSPTGREFVTYPRSATEDQAC
ncbi:HNH endonuclease signature motif containing protein [Calidifontibacter terrae]